MHKNEVDYATGVYKCTDSIKNFKIRIRLQQEKSSYIPLPDFQHAEPTESEFSHTGIDNSHIEERVFSWQEKVFSLLEVSRYQNAANCVTPLEEKYHHDVTDICQNGIPNNRLYSVTSADDFTDMDETNLSITSDAKPTITPLLRSISELRQRQKIGGHRRLHRNKQAFCPRRDIVDYSPTDETIRRNHLLETFPLVMYILGDLSIRDEDSTAAWYGKSEYVLCTIRFDPASGTLTVSPDFTLTDGLSRGSTAEPYRVEVDGDARHVYQYWIEHASHEISLEEDTREVDVGNKLRAHQADLRHLTVGADFAVPRAGLLIVHLLGEIVSARLFEHDHLFAHYFVQLPKGWTSSSRLDGVTHCCATRGTDIANFGHTFEMELELDLDAVLDDPDRLPRWPQLFIEVLSLDSWSRYRTEGYGYMHLPTSPGDHRATVSTWRPLSEGVVGEMRRFFVGGSPELDEATYVAVPTDVKGPVLSKYGVRTIASGDVDVRLSVIHQSHGSLAAKHGGASYLLERLSAATLVTSVNNALKAFKQARDRMLAAKQGLELTD